MTNAEENATILELTAALAAAERVKQRLLQEIRYLRQETFASCHHGEIVGSSPALQAARCKMSLVAGTDTASTGPGRVRHGQGIDRVGHCIPTAIAGTSRW